MDFLKGRINKKYFEISMYVIFTCIAIYLLSKVTDHTPFILKKAGDVLNWVGAIFKPAIIGFIIAYLLFPMLNKIEKLLRKIKFFKNKKSVRGLAVAIQYLIIFFGIFVIVSMLISAVTNQLQTANSKDILEVIKSYTTSINKLYGDVIASLDRLNINSDEIRGGIDTAIRSTAHYLLGISRGLGNFVNNIKDILTTTLFALIFSVYFLLDTPTLKKYWGKVFNIILPEKAKNIFGTLIEDADKVFSGYIRGQVIDALMLGVVVSIIFSIIGIQYAPVIGLLIGLGSLIPYMGPIIGYISIIVVGIVTSDYKNMIATLIALLIIQAIDANLIYPKLLSKSINIHPMIVIISLLVGAGVGGLPGMIVALPTGALLKIWFERLVGIKEKRIKNKQ